MNELLDLTIERFEATGMATEMPEDSDKLPEILDGAVQQVVAMPG